MLKKYKIQLCKCKGICFTNKPCCSGCLLRTDMGLLHMFSDTQ